MGALLTSNTFAQTDFLTFWDKFKVAVISGDKAAVAQMTKFPFSIYDSKIKDRAEFDRSYDKIFKGEANASQCFARAKPQQGADKTYEVYCPFKKTPNDWENAPIRFIFESTKNGWKFTGLDNINE